MNTRITENTKSSSTGLFFSVNFEGYLSLNLIVSEENHHCETSPSSISFTLRSFQHVSTQTLWIARWDSWSLRNLVDGSSMWWFWLVAVQDEQSTSKTGLLDMWMESINSISKRPHIDYAPCRCSQIAQLNSVCSKKIEKKYSTSSSAVHRCVTYKKRDIIRPVLQAFIVIDNLWLHLQEPDGMLHGPSLESYTCGVKIYLLYSEFWCYFWEHWTLCGELVIRALSPVPRVAI